MNISNILFVTINPPAILTDDNNTAKEAKACGKEPGRYPPPNIKRPPTAVIPDIAFVIDIRGVCRAGVTPQTEKYPVITDRDKIVLIVKIAGSGQTNPNPRVPSKPAEIVNALFNVF